MENKPIAYSYLRVSSDIQLKGDGIRRQMQKAEDYCTEQGLTLSPDTFKDLGVSAYKGNNRLGGSQLSAFLAAVDEGRIKKGSILIVEALDRISRQTVTKALGLFTSILERGIKIITLIDKKEFTEESVNKNEMDFMYSLMLFSQANKESEYKRIRIGDDWENKRNNLGHKKITNNIPFWLKLKDNEFTVIEENAELIQFIFKSYLKGDGPNKISRILNNRGLKTPMGKKWGQVNVKLFLKSPSVIGEFHVGKRINGKKVKTGQIEKGYYPAIVTESDFYRVQERFKSNPPKIGKPQTEGCNLFDGLLKCGYCGGNMGLYAEENLICWNGINGGCVRAAWPRSEYELSLLIECREALEERRAELNTPIYDDIDSINGKIANREKKLNNGMRLLIDFPEEETLKAEMKSIRTEIDVLKAERESKKAIISEFKGDNIIDIERIAITKEPKHRVGLNRLIKKHFSKIDVFFVGNEKEHAEYLKKRGQLESAGLSGHQFHRSLKTEMEIEKKRFVVIHCKSSVVRDGNPTNTIKFFPSDPSPENEKAYWSLYANG